MSAPGDFQALYDAELAYVVRTLARLGVAAADLEDAAQEVFLVVYRRRAERDPARPVRPWLFGIAYRVVGNYVQKAHRRREVGGEALDALAPAAAAESPASAAERSEERARLLAALGALDLEHRAAAVLFDLEGLPAPAVADVLGIPINTVYSRVRHARLRLAELLGGGRGESR